MLLMGDDANGKFCKAINIRVTAYVSSDRPCIL
jgi:hypothetical protein